MQTIAGGNTPVHRYGSQLVCDIQLSTTFSPFSVGNQIDLSQWEIILPLFDFIESTRSGGGGLA